MAPSDPDWARLPDNLLDLISDKLDLLSDYVRFSAVCPSWRSIGMQNQKRWNNNTTTCSSNSNPPMLMIPTKDSSKKNRSLYSITDEKIYKFQLPVPYNMRCCGSSHGWLAFYKTNRLPFTFLYDPFRFRLRNKIIMRLPPVIKTNIVPFLYNPFLLRNNTISLPRINTPHFGDATLVKVVLSANPALTTPSNNNNNNNNNNNDFVVAAIYSIYKRLAFLKPGDESWTYVDEDFRPCSDVIFYRGRILAVNTFGGIISVDLSNNNQVKIISQSGRNLLFCRGYLVESSARDDLWLIARKFYDAEDMDEEELGEENHIFVTKTFEVYKLVLDDQTGMVVNKIAVKNLGEEALFLGDNYSMSVLASSNKYSGLKPNSIYYTADFLELDPKYGPRDTGIFNLEDGSFDQHYFPDPSQTTMPRPIWIAPTLQGFGMGVFSV